MPLLCLLTFSWGLTTTLRTEGHPECSGGDHRRPLLGHVPLMGGQGSEGVGLMMGPPQKTPKVSPFVPSSCFCVIR